MGKIPKLRESSSIYIFVATDLLILYRPSALVGPFPVSTHLKRYLSKCFLNDYGF